MEKAGTVNFYVRFDPHDRKRWEDSPYSVKASVWPKATFNPALKTAGEYREAAWVDDLGRGLTDVDLIQIYGLLLCEVQQGVGRFGHIIDKIYKQISHLIQEADVIHGG